jgi:hypothetical protein
MGVTMRNLRANRRNALESIERKSLKGKGAGREKV